MSCQGNCRSQGSNFFCGLFLLALFILAFVLGVIAINGYDHKTNVVETVVEKQIKVSRSHYEEEFELLERQAKLLKKLDDDLVKQIDAASKETIKVVKADGWLTRERIKQLDAKDQHFFEAVLKKLDAILCRLDD